MKKSALICLAVSLAIMLVALVMSLCGYGIHFGLDFAGGLILKYDMGQPFDTTQVENALKEIGVSECTVSVAGEDGITMQARIPSLGSEDEIQLLQAALEEKLLALYPAMDVSQAVASYVGPVAGRTLVRNAIFSVLLAAALMLVYIAFRFDLASGVAAVIGLLHDVLIMLSFMVLLRNIIQMNSSFIAAMLTIVGYSINNTIVIFDRIRENREAVKRDNNNIFDFMDSEGYIRRKADAADGNALHIGTALERILTDLRDALRNDDMPQAGAFFKSLLSDFCNSLRQIDFTQSAASGKCLCADRCHAIGKCHGFEAGASPAEPVGNFRDQLRNGEIFQTDAIPEQVAAKTGYGFGQTNLRHMAAPERHTLDGNDPFRQCDRREPCASAMTTAM